MRRKKKSENNGFNVWRSYSDMMAGVLLLFVLIMCVTLFQAQKSYNESLQERDEKIALQEEYTQELLDKQNALDKKDETLQNQDAQLKTQDEKLAEQEQQLAALAAKLKEQESTLNAQQSALDEKTAQLKDQQAQIDQIIGVKADVIEALKNEFSKNNINVDIILQSVGREGTKDISFTVASDDLEHAIEVLNANKERLTIQDITWNEKVAKLSIVGAGMMSNPGVAAKMFESLYNSRVNINMISTSEIRITVQVPEEDIEKAMNAVHDGFGLGA